MLFKGLRDSLSAAIVACSMLKSISKDDDSKDEVGPIFCAACYPPHEPARAVFFLTQFELRAPCSGSRTNNVFGLPLEESFLTLYRRPGKKNSCSRRIDKTLYSKITTQIQLPISSIFVGVSVKSVRLLVAEKLIFFPVGSH